MGAGVGSELQGYRLKRVIGEGGMAIVYLAERLADGEKVALKLLREELLDNKDFRKRFVRESGYAASLDHPNVVKVFDAGETADAVYIAMQYVEGSDLYALLEDGPLEPEGALAVVAQVGAALDAAHLTGLLHRDVKPGNVLTTSTGQTRAPRCLLTDFGLGKHTTRDSVALTAAGTFVGTLAYTAPEQMIGPEPGASADIYSLGCLLYECLAGETPFTGGEVEMMQAHIESDPPRLSKKGSPFPPQLDAVIETAMAKEPGERYGTCAEMVDAAAAALGLLAPAVFPPEGIEKLDGALELLVTAGNAVGLKIRVADKLRIGRGEPGQGALGNDLEISRLHAEFSRHLSGGLMVEDLGSTNGTFLNGRQTMGLELVRPGDEVELGSTKLLAFVASEEPSPEPPAAGPPAPPPEPVITQEPVPAAGAAAAEPAMSRLSLRLQLGLAAGEATLELDGGSQPIRVVHDGARWRVGPPRG